MLRKRLVYFKLFFISEVNEQKNMNPQNFAYNLYFHNILMLQCVTFL